ncbi:polysaccharide deacetylase family protein [Candidatus Woesearchaeota archaeon]|nr:polysaccharide deacetylase family protein [Candidatus Woesearchaeota archaeon]
MNKINQRRVATIQVDLDGLWTNLEYYGYKSEVSPDVVFQSSIPRFLELFEKYNVKATFFLIGKDGEVKKKADLVKQIVKAGHEIANHTYSHTFGFRKLSPAEKIKEIEKGEEVIQRIIGKKPVGFKVPGYDIDVETLKILEQKEYIYDSSVIPTGVYPLIMKINQLISGGVKRTHGPKWNWFLAPNRIYRPSLENEWKNGDTNIVELPPTVIPIIRVPFHATFATKFGLNFFKFGHYLTEKFNLHLNYEFHAADLADDIEDERLAHLKAISFEKRFLICESIIKKISQKYEVVTSEELIKMCPEKKK